jgi:membrane protein
MGEIVARIADFINRRVWEYRLKDLGVAKAWIIRTLRVFLFASRKFVADRCDSTAAVLTYYSLLNVVPLLAVAFAIAKGFGLKRLIEKQILQLAGQAGWQHEATDYLLEFANNLLHHTKSGLIAGVGVVLLLYTVISILGKIEWSFNEIREIKASRTLIRKFTDYMALMVVSPVLLVVSSSATVLVASKIRPILGEFALLGVFGYVVLFVLNLLPYVSIWVLLTALYLIMPNAKVPFRSAVIGGIAAGTITQIVQWVYINFQIGVAKYGAIYGSFAALPLFLVWLQISWMIVLFGAEIAYASEHTESYGFHPDYSAISPSDRRLLMLRICHLLIARFSRGDRPLSAQQIAEKMEIPVRLVQELLETLSTIGLVVETRIGRFGKTGYQPGRATEDITIMFVLEQYDKYGERPVPEPAGDEAVSIARYLKEIAEAGAQSPGNMRLKEIANEAGQKEHPGGTA